MVSKINKWHIRGSAMKNIQKIQNILDSLISHLESAVNVNLHHALGLTREMSPLDYFLSNLKDELPNDFNPVLFTKIYREAFYTDPIPKNKNHIAIICEGHNDKQNFPEYRLWIDLDKLATTLGRHYQMPSSSQLFITKNYASRSSETMRIDGIKIYTSLRSAINSNWDPRKTGSLLLLGTIYGSMASGVMLVLGMLALASLIAISSTNIGLLFAGAAVTAGIASYCFFQQNKNKKLEVLKDEKSALQSVLTDHLKPISIETAFKNNVVQKNNAPELSEQSVQFSPV